MENTCYNYYCCYVAALISCLMFCLSMASVNMKTDQAALLAIKSSLNDPYNIIADNWSTATSPCQWIGVTCSSRHPRVAALNLSNMALWGTIAPEIGNLSFLSSLDLSGNDFRGYLPQDVANLQRLKFISLAFNKFSGEIPSGFGFLTELQFLNLRNNTFSGSLPVPLSNMSQLESLDLSSNLIQGKIPEEIGRLANLRILALQFNRLTWSIPSTVFNISTLEIIAFGKNSLSGNLPANICDHLQNLKGFYVAFNELVGQIPSNFSGCSKLQNLSLGFNNFVGAIPRTIGTLKNLHILDLDSNNLTGTMPQEVGNLGRLKVLDLGGNNLTGVIPKEITNLHQLEVLTLSANSITGTIPSGIFNISSLRVIQVNHNHLSGNLPPSLGYGLPNLKILLIDGNNLSGVISNSIPQSPDQLLDLSFITSLTSCRNLKVLSLSGNPLNGVLPSSIGNLSMSLEVFQVFRCNIKGRIPDGIGNLSSLIDLALSDNELTGLIPTTINGLKDLQRLSFANNQLTGSIPVEFCYLQELGLIYLGENQLSGSIPECLERMTSLRYLRLQSNKLNSTITSSLWKMKDLLELDLSSNSLTGSLPPEMGNLRVATAIDLSMNNFSGIIPSTIGGLQNLAYLSLAHNKLQGSIPKSFGGLFSLVNLNLSQNNLSSLIPKSLEALQYLQFFNVSFNHLTGEIPSGGPFKNFTSLSFLSNGALCGPPRFGVPPCSGNSTSIHKSKGKVIRIVSILVGIATTILALSLAFVLFKSRRAQNKDPKQTDILPVTKPPRISYYELVQATNDFSENNLLGKGSFGSVFKGILKSEMSIAVKVFNLEMEGAFKSFDIECEVLRNLRHRNLVKIISACSNSDFKALVLEYMPNGNLEKWLYSENYVLDFKERLNIMINVACALEYLHQNYIVPVIHCDLKPSNVLLDKDMVARVSDFGIAKLLGETESVVHTKTLATLEYMAPEYGLDGLVSTKCDIYSFGILLMETFTRRKPSDEIFNGDFTLRTWVNDSLPNSLIRVIDAKLLRPTSEYLDEECQRMNGPMMEIPDDNLEKLEKAHLSEKLKCAKSIMELALNCSMESPRERINIKDVVVALENIKHQLLEYCTD